MSLLRPATTKLGHVWEALRENYWLVPATMTAAAVILAFVVFGVDQAVLDAEFELPAWFYRSGVAGARAILATIATAMITVAGLTFSITMVALVLASQQFGPRVLRSFFRDRGNQYVLGTFLAGFLFSLVSLGLQEGAEGEEAVPRVSVTVGLFLATAGVGVLIYFINHVAKSIQASHVCEAVTTELHQTIERLLPDRTADQAPPPESLPSGEKPPSDAHVICAADSGYLQAIDIEYLVKLASENDLTLFVRVRPGDFVTAGSAILAASGQECPAKLEQEVHKAFVVGRERTMTQDLEFGLYQLTEVAVRALSPGINDPHTALTCVDRLGEVLAEVAGRPLPATRHHDEEGRSRVVLKPFTFEGMVNIAFNEVRQYGGGSVSVSIRLLEALQLLAGRTNDSGRRSVLVAQAEMVMRQSKERLSEPNDLADLEERYRELVKVLHGPGAGDKGANSTGRGE